jgi:hypothetical protein
MLLLAISGGLTGWLPVILIILALVLFVIAAFWTPPAPSWNRLVAAGLFFWLLAVLIQMLGGL